MKNDLQKDHFTEFLIRLESNTKHGKELGKNYRFEWEDIDFCVFIYLNDFYWRVMWINLNFILPYL